MTPFFTSNVFFGFLKVNKVELRKYLNLLCGVLITLDLAFMSLATKA